MREPKDINILVAEDDQILRQAIVFEFKRKGFKMFEAVSGKEAWEIFKNQKIDIILSDIKMPNGDGLELLDSVRKDNPGLPVFLFLSGFAEVSVDEAKKRGAFGIIKKPFDRSVLLDTVAQILALLDKK